MKHIALRLAATLLLAAFAQPGAAADAAALAEAMQQARYSDGFTVRMNIASIQPNGRRAMPFKLAVIGQIDAKRQRLLIKGISPDMVRNRFVVAERNADGRIRAIGYTEPSAADIGKVDPTAPLFDSGLVLWDMLAPWWEWPRQNMGETEQIAGRSCTLVRSQTDENFSPIREVISCVDEKARLSLRTQLFDRRHTLIRTISVKQTMRKDSGALAAKKLTITDHAVTEVEVYSGDEHYQVTADTFAQFDAYRAAEK
ncbi:MAG TPA: hypothetical protein VFW59_02225 [Gallionella sp.]|nr:hypothetical protein [Gallionella sp.]